MGAAIVNAPARHWRARERARRPFITLPHCIIRLPGRTVAGQLCSGDGAYTRPGANNAQAAGRPGRARARSIKHTRRRATIAPGRQTPSATSWPATSLAQRAWRPGAGGPRAPLAARAPPRAGRRQRVCARDIRAHAAPGAPKRQPARGRANTHAQPPALINKPTAPLDPAPDTPTPGAGAPPRVRARAHAHARTHHIQDTGRPLFRATAHKTQPNEFYFYRRQ